MSRGLGDVYKRQALIPPVVCAYREPAPSNSNDVSIVFIGYVIGSDYKFNVFYRILQYSVLFRLAMTGFGRPVYNKSR